MGETRMFYKSKTKSVQKMLSKSHHSTKFQARFMIREKSLVKISGIKTKDLSISCLLKESASILEQAEVTVVCK